MNQTGVSLNFVVNGPLYKPLDPTPLIVLTSTLRTPAPTSCQCRLPVITQILSNVFSFRYLRSDLLSTNIDLVDLVSTNTRL